MALRPEVSIGAGLGLVGLEVGVFQLTMPNVSDVKQVEPYNRDIDSSRKTAMWISIALVSGISLLLRDSGVFIVGGLGAIGLNYLYAHADAVSPVTGKVSETVRGGLSSVPGQVAQEAPDTGAIYIDEDVA